VGASATSIGSAPPACCCKRRRGGDVRAITDQVVLALMLDGTST
jgi:hypothetical protein